MKSGVADDASPEEKELTQTRYIIAGSLFSEINFEELFEGERDRLYTLEYIMKMFTYETSALEGIYNMGRQDVEDDNTVSTV